MNTIKIIPAFLFGAVSYWEYMFKHANIAISTVGPFAKQTHRNRFEISAPNKRQILSVPVLYESRKSGCERVRISYREPWQREHLRSLEAAYRAAPYYEIYAQDLNDILSLPHEYLMDLNTQSLLWVADKLQWKLPECVKNASPNIYDRELIIPLRETYFQNFSDRRPFDNNVSILDLLFQKGPETSDWLKR